jgi:hypothetical protein
MLSESPHASGCDDSKHAAHNSRCYDCQLQPVSSYKTFICVALELLAGLSLVTTLQPVNMEQ